MIIDSPEIPFEGDDINELNGMDIQTLTMPSQRGRRLPSVRGRRARGQRGSQNFNGRIWSGVGRSLAGDGDDQASGTISEDNTAPVPVNPAIEGKNTLQINFKEWIGKAITPIMLTSKRL
jgi:hypothetical protein